MIMTDDIGALSLAEYSAKIREKKLSPKDGVSYYLSRIGKENESLKAYLEIFPGALSQAEEVEKRIASGAELPLAGIPLAVKDNILIHGKTASSGSQILRDYRASYDATVIEKLRAAGAVFLGRTNMDEFAMGSSTENSSYFQTKNPHDKTRVPGGSSGGSAAAVAAGLALAALGSDTGGSIRQPASFCGVVGLKPTYGAVSRYGLMALASSLDQIGPLGRSVSDTKILFDVIKGKDPKDSTSLLPVRPKRALKKKLAYPKDFLENGLDAGVKKNFEESIARLTRAGYQVEGVPMPELSYSLATYYIIMPAEASANLARYDGIRYGLSEPGADVVDGYFKTRGAGFGKEPRRRILLGTYVLSAGYYDAYYKKANRARGIITDAFRRVFSEYDALISPTSPVPPFKIGEKSDNPLEMYLADVFTVSANLAGIPAISIPSGVETYGGTALPMGLQISGAHFDEETLFDIGGVFEKIS